ncbi:ferritin-like domain-containing protein [Hymenobacter cellulosilyticus]|uniref:Ferritin-like domain-containing protein n=1 Tax=Hymenobacter cellulosilyticus TaxID=2932248 RepID=A0A8T9Q973_9BACT|nr:ferritin-like domain-containing protein [Hymenobacter cellulosilyticus]UOQ72360.1 ferritin-like domain-containing protein [Hymenobacter cellulosilyticus]
MNILQLLADLAAVDPESYQRLSGRRGALTSLGQTGRRAVAAAVPLAFGTMLTKAYGRRSNTVLDAFSLALTLEYLESEFYKQALASALVFPGSSKAVFQQIYQHEQDHVALLQETLRLSGAALPDKPKFDFTGSKNGTRAALFPTVFQDFSTFLKVAQLLEDTGVRAYKGQADSLFTDNDLLEAAIRIHAVEARHAAHIRGLRRAQGANVRPWISKGEEVITVKDVTDAVYIGEDLDRQQLPAVDTKIPFFPNDTTQIVTSTADKAKLSLAEAFDEPISSTTASTIASLFIYS